MVRIKIKGVNRIQPSPDPDFWSMPPLPPPTPPPSSCAATLLSLSGRKSSNNLGNREDEDHGTAVNDDDGQKPKAKMAASTEKTKVVSIFYIFDAIW